jgi:hypothetical protein
MLLFERQTGAIKTRVGQIREPLDHPRERITPWHNGAP